MATSERGSRRGLAIAIALGVLAAGAATAWWALRDDGGAGDALASDTRAVEEAYGRLRRAIVEGDDEAFFLMHSARARDEALADFPLVRSMYLGQPEEERQVFRERFRVEEEEFLRGDPRALVVRMLPHRSGWHERRGLFAVARVKDVRFEEALGDGGTRERRAVVLLDVPAELRLTEDQVIEDRFLPTVVFVRDPDGWRRRSFFSDGL